jgi:hypothetical protein
MSDDQEKEVYSPFVIHQEPDVEAEEERARFLWKTYTPGEKGYNADYTFEGLCDLINTQNGHNSNAPLTDLNLKNAFAAQAEAMKKANEAQINRADAYRNAINSPSSSAPRQTPQAPVTREIPVIEDFYTAVDDWHQNNYDDVYLNYETELADRIEGQMGAWDEQNRLPDNATQDEIDQHTAARAKAYATAETASKALLASSAFGYAGMLDLRDKLNELDEEKSFLENVCSAVSEMPLDELKSLYQLHDDCKAAGKLDAFNQMWASHLAEDKFRQGTINGEMPRDKNGAHPYEGSNKHSFGLTRDKDGNAMLRHTIQNLNNTGLDICTIDGKIGFTRSLSYLTPDQINALADYCATNHIAIDNFGALNALKIQDKDGKVHKKTVWNAEKGQEEEVDKPASEMLQEALLERTGSVNGKEEEKHLAPELDFSKCLPKEDPKYPTKEQINEKMIKKFGIAGINENLIKQSWGGWNSTILSIYGSESDMLNDGQYDKDGLQKHLKKLSVKYNRTRPPSVSYYIRPGEKFLTDYARVALAAAKEQGCEYFNLPPATAIGKEQRGAFFEASVKEKMVPLLKSKDNPDGMDIGAGDVSKLQELMDKEDDLKDSTTERIKYMIKWHEQLKAHEKYLQSQNPPKQLPATIANLKGTFQEKILFDEFSVSTKPALEKMMTEMYEKKEPQAWDKIDRLSAIKAMTKIMQDLHEGKLDGKEFDPLASENTENMKGLLKRYMVNNRKECEADFEAALKGNKDEKDSVQNRAIQAVEQSYLHKLNEISGTVKANGGPEMKFNDSFPKPTIPYDKTRSQGQENGKKGRTLYNGEALTVYNTLGRGGRS